jgi:uncharacterized membrane protein
MSKSIKTIRSIYFREHWEITIILIISSLYAAAIVAVRIYLSSKINYLFFIWNLFLAWIPYLISIYLPVAYYKIRQKFIAYLLLVIWFLFWPNSPYILTDMLHLKQKPGIPLWFDMGMILSFAWTGLMLGFISLIEIQNLVRKRFNRKAGWAFAAFMSLIGALGIYLGRYGRINSWDVLSPDKLYTTLAMHTNDKLVNNDIIGMTLMYGMFLFLGYITVKIIIKIPDRMAL